MGGKSDPPPAPDYSQLAAASEKSAQYAYQLGQDQLQWAKDQYAQNSEVSNAVIDAALGRQEQSDQQAAQDRARYEQIFQPLEEQLAYDAQTYASPERKEKAAGEAEAGVAQKFQQARTAAQQKLEQFGVDPSQTRQGALDLQSRVAEAASQASAGNQARNALDAQQLALRSEAINVGRGYPGQIATQYGTALNAGTQAAGTGLSTTASGAQTMGTGAEWQGLGNQAITGWGNILNQGYQNQLAGWQAQQQNSSGFGDILGMVAGVGTNAIMGKLGFAEGGDVPPDPTALPPPQTAIPVPHSGVAIPPGASPTGGAGVDDVPANLTAGEFVMPRDVVSWFGQKGMQQMIMKARKEMNPASGQAPAQPQQGGPQNGPPQVQTAIPMPGR